MCEANIVTYNIIIRWRLLSLPFLTQQWSKVRTSGKKPPARDWHSACIIDSDITGHHPLLMVVGGVGNSLQVFSDVWFLDVTNALWSEVCMIDI